MSCGKKFNILLSLTGLCLSGFAYYVELRKSEDDSYVAICDISESVSCTDVLTSHYAKGFGIIGRLLGDENHPLNQPNPIYGLLFYAIILLLTLCEDFSLVTSLKFYLILSSNFGSIYLGYLLYFVLKKACILCIATYILNFILLVTTYFKKRSLNYKRLKQQKSSDFMGNNKLKNEPRLPFDFKKNI